MTQAEVQALFRRFAAPLAGYAATSVQRKEGAEFIARTLWTALIAGPEMEVQTWKAFQKHAALDEESLQTIKDLYYEKMKPVVTEEQRAALQQRYSLRKKE